MKINRVATEMFAPEWIFSKEGDAGVSSDMSITVAEAESMISRVDDPSDDSLVMERDLIEKCAENSGVYYCNSSWSNSTKSNLKEYALACGLHADKFKVIDYDGIISRVASIQNGVDNSTITKTASNDMVLDAFRLDEKAETKHMDKAEWQNNKPQSKISEKPSVSANAVCSLRGGENYFTNSDVKTARGQNSITNPNAIEEFSKTEDSGDAIRKQIASRKESKKASHEEWQSDKVKAMSGSEIIPYGKVFMTEDMNAQSGIGTSDRIKKYHGFDVEGLPEKTAGEQLAGKNESRKKSIQRDVDNSDWEAVQTESKRTISDDFSESLKRALSK